MGVWIVCLSGNQVYAWCLQGWKKLIDPMELELLMIVSYHVDAEDWL